jgi:type VI protein secretion system component Hcp
LIPLAVAGAMILAGATTAAAQPSSGQVTYEMTLEGLTGGKKSTTLTIESWSWGASAYDLYEDEVDATGKDGTATKRKRDIAVQDFYFTIEQSPTSAQLLDALVAKRVLSKVTVRSKQTGTDKTFEIVFKDVRISSFQSGGSGYGGGTESIALAYKTAKLTVGASGGSQSADVTGNVK